MSSKKKPHGKGGGPPTIDTRMRRILAGSLSVSALSTMSPMDVVNQVRKGVPAQLVVRLGQDMGISQEKLFGTLGLARPTIARKLRAEKNLSPDESERVLAMARLIGQVEEMVEQSGDPDGFDAARWVGQWLERPHAAFGGARPSEFMDTATGRSLVTDLVARMQSGAYA